MKELDGAEVDFFKVPCEFSPSAALWRGALWVGPGSDAHDVADTVSHCSPVYRR